MISFSQKHVEITIMSWMGDSQLMKVNLVEVYLFTYYTQTMPKAETTHLYVKLNTNAMVFYKLKVKGVILITSKMPNPL